MKRIVNTPDAPAPVGPYNQSVLVGEILYTSGQIAIDPNTNQLIVDRIEDETRQVMRNIEAILTAARTTWSNVIKCSIFVTDINDYSRINEVYSSYFDEETAPARELVEVANLPKEVHIEISVIALVPEK